MINVVDFTKWTYLLTFDFLCVFTPHINHENQIMPVLTLSKYKKAQKKPYYMTMYLKHEIAFLKFGHLGGPWLDQVNQSHYTEAT